MNLDKLKESARRFEQKEDWRRAIDVYQRALADLAAAGESIPDPSVYNRVGDLHMKVGESHAAVQAYDQALELYADQGFLNNAIALGGKILRVEPGRTATHLRLARLHARKNVATEVRHHLGEYLERMRRSHRLSEAIEALRSFAARDCRDAEMRTVVADLLAQKAPAGDEGTALDALLQDLRNRGNPDEDATPGATHVRGLVFLDTDLDWTPGRTSDGPTGGAEVGAVEGLTTVEATLPGLPDATPLAGLEATEFSSPADLPVDSMADIEREEATFRDGSGDLAADVALEITVDSAIDDPIGGLVGTAGAVTDDLALVSTVGLDVEVADDGPMIELFDAVLDDDLPVEIDLDPPAPASGGDHPADQLLTPAPAEDDPLLVLEERLARAEIEEDWPAALEAAAGLVRLEPAVIPRYQKRVELAYRAGDPDSLTASYLELGDALLRAGMRVPAVAVYRRVLEHHPGQSRALGALASLGVAVDPPAPPATPAAPAGTEYVDLAALILDDRPAPDSRMRIDSADPTEPEDEDRTFREILDQFKRGIEENLGAEDFQAHYDLGIAFKEMGLLDEAIAQFQRALRAPDGRLRSSEALGIAFHDKGRHAIAEAVLRRAIEGLPGGDDEKIGLIYWLGRALEAQGREREAVAWYERALAVDIRFLDLADRLGRLSVARDA